MNIKEYTNIYESLKKFNDEQKKALYGNTVLDEEPLEKKVFPFTIIQEIRNVANQQYDTRYDTVSNLGYSIDIFAKQKGNISKQTIAREIALKVNEFMTEYVGLSRVGFIPNNIVMDGAVCRITMTYNGNLHENRNKFI